MGQVTRTKQQIKTSLRRVQRKLKTAVKWTGDQTSPILLEVAEPFAHLAPYGDRTCNSVRNDDCGEIGIMMAVFDRMKPKARKKAVKTKSRR